jgi:hypothetical protein
MSSCLTIAHRSSVIQSLSHLDITDYTVQSLSTAKTTNITSYLSHSLQSNQQTRLTATSWPTKHTAYTAGITEPNQKDIDYMCKTTSQLIHLRIIRMDTMGVVLERIISIDQGIRERKTVLRRTSSLGVESRDDDRIMTTIRGRRTNVTRMKITLRLHLRKQETTTFPKHTIPRRGNSTMKRRTEECPVVSTIRRSD